MEDFQVAHIGTDGNTSITPWDYKIIYEGEGDI